MDALILRVARRFRQGSGFRVLGEVGVDSGALLVIDPAYLRHWGTGEHPDLSNEGMRAALAQERQQLYFANGTKAAVVVKGFAGDGTYPVTVKEADSDAGIAGFTVDFTRQQNQGFGQQR